jgi:hypothetical protein
MLALMNFSRQLKQEDLNMVMLPGRFSGEGEFNRSYWIINNQEKNQVMQEFFAVEKPLQVLGDDTPAIAPQQMKIAIQNATGQSGVAAEVSNYLKEQGFTNVYLTQDYTDTLDETQIIAQKGDLENAKILQTSIKLGRVEASSTGQIDSDFTIRIGKDWLERQPGL